MPLRHRCPGLWGPVASTAETSLALDVGSASMTRTIMLRGRRSRSTMRERRILTLLSVVVHLLHDDAT
eukprot:6895192-Pyramimonas_sp.AAC.1